MEPQRSTDSFRRECGGWVLASGGDGASAVSASLSFRAGYARAADATFAAGRGDLAALIAGSKFTQVGKASGIRHDETSKHWHQERSGSFSCIKGSATTTSTTNCSPTWELRSYSQTYFCKRPAVWARRSGDEGHIDRHSKRCGSRKGQGAHREADGLEGSIGSGADGGSGLLDRSV